MKQNADALSGAVESGIVLLFDLFKKSAARDSLPSSIRIHLIGHSAGAIVHTWLGARALRKNLDLATISFMAPAVRLDTFDAQLGRAIATRRIPVLLAFLSDTAERADATCHPYLHSLLYLVSRSFEDHDETPILGMEKHLIPAIPTHDWGGLIHQLRSPGAVFQPGNQPIHASYHGQFSDDVAVMEAIAGFIKSFPP
jgi:pimeloyl-ACP methyl ester carboxylesterase